MGKIGSWYKHWRLCRVPVLYLFLDNVSRMPKGRLKCSAHVVQLFGLEAQIETYILWYFGHHCCLVVGFDALGIWHFWIFTLFHPFLLFCTHFFPISTTPTLFLS